MPITALSPWGAIFMTPASANSILSSASFLFQVPDKAGLSPLASPAVATRPARASRPEASTRQHMRFFGTMMFDPPSRDRWRNGRRRAGREPDGGESGRAVYKLASARLYVKPLPELAGRALRRRVEDLVDGQHPRYTAGMGRQKTITDDEVLRIARNVFRAQGHTATTREIAQAAGISEAVLY